MSYAALMVWVNVDHVSKQFVGVAASVADKFAANLIGLSAVVIVPPFAIPAAPIDHRARTGPSLR